VSDQPGALPAGRPAAGNHEIEADGRRRWTFGAADRSARRGRISAGAWLPTAGSLAVFLDVWRVLSRF